MKQEVLDFIKQHKLAVVATTDGQGKPQAAVVEFGELDDLTIVIDTLKTSRKYRNLQQKQDVAVVIGWDEDKTMQINAVAEELSGEELERAKAAYFAKNDRARKWERRPDIAYFALKPIWIRYSDVGQDPWHIYELHRELLEL